MISSTQRFSSRVDFYVRSRPKYPPALLRFFQNQMQLSPTHAVADIGSGTGFLTEMFVHSGNPTYAVEPNDDMRLAAETSLKEWPNFHSVIGTAEATRLADRSVDLITAAQAFHWFDGRKAAVEFRRITKPKGVIALIWNERLTSGSAFMVDYEQLIQQYSRPGETCRGRMLENDGESKITKFFDLLGASHQLEKFDNPQTLDRDGLVDRVTSSSYMPLPTDSGYAEMLSRVQSLFDKHHRSNAVTILHETRVYHARVGED
jgi:SAM-dependent methyltransferase